MAIFVEYVNAFSLWYSSAMLERIDGSRKKSALTFTYIVSIDASIQSDRITGALVNRLILLMEE